jgi:glycosyltransferase involved in cell wall biosynthesis
MPPDIVAQTSVEVVIIGLNEADRLEACVRSVRRAWSEVRSDADLSIRYVDSDSTDGSRAIARRAADEVLVLTSAPSAAAARQAGLKEATADWILFLDGDMELDAGWFSYCLAREDLMEDPFVAGIVGTRTDHVDRSSRRIENVYGVRKERRAWHVGGALFARREWLRSVGGYRPEIWAGEEPELLARLNHAAAHVCEVPVKFIDHFVDHPLSTRGKLRRWIFNPRSPRHSFAKATLHALKGGYILSFLRVHQYTTITWAGDLISFVLLAAGSGLGAAGTETLVFAALGLRGRMSHWFVARLMALGICEEIIRCRGTAAPPELRYHDSTG